MFKIKKSYRGLYKLIFVLLLIIFIHYSIKNYMFDSYYKIVLFFVLGVLYYHIIMIVHELVHYTFVPNRKLNEFLGNVLAPSVGLNFKQYRDHHLRHHWSKTVKDDPDAYIYWPVIKEKTWHKRIKIFIFGSVSELFTKIKLKSFPKTKEKFFIKHSVLLAQVIVFLLFIIFSKLVYYFIFWLGPIIIVGLFLNRMRVLIEHGYDFENNINSTPQITVNIKSNFLERIIFAPHNFNYHQEHHDFPGIPYYQLPEFYKSKINNKKHKKIQHSYLSMLFAILFGIRLKN